MAEDPPATPRRQHGHSRAYILDRLKRERQTDLAAAVEAGTVSAFAAAVSLGWMKRPPSAAAVTPQARRRRLGFQALSGGLSSGQAMELWLGPNPTQGSLFGSREELMQAWQKHRAEIMRQWGSHGRRPMAWWEFDAGDLEHPGYSHERSYLYEHNVLSEEERVEVETEWRQAFDAAKGKGARERREAYEFADIPAELIARWMPQKKKRLVASVESLS